MADHTPEAFLAELQASPRTTEAYSLQLVSYLAPWLQEHQVALQDLTWVQFLAYLKHRGWGYSMSKQCLSACRKYLRWTGVTDHELLQNNLHRVEPERGYVLTPDDVKALGMAGSYGSDRYLRNLAMLLTSYRCGLRSRELIGLRVQDVDFDGHAIYVREGKGGRKEMAPLDPEAAAWIGSYLDRVRPKYAAPGVEALWVGINGKTPGQGMTTDGWRATCRKWGARAGVPRFSPHTCRRGFAHDALRAGIPSEVVRRAGRWRSWQAFDRYTQDIGPQDYLAARQATGAKRVGPSLPAGPPQGGEHGGP